MPSRGFGDFYIPVYPDAELAPQRTTITPRSRHRAQAAGVDRVKTEADRFAAKVMPVSRERARTTPRLLIAAMALWLGGPLFLGQFRTQAKIRCKQTVTVSA